MLTTNFTRDFLNLQDVEIENIENLDNCKRIYIKLVRKTVLCPCCNSETSKIHDYRTQVVRDCKAFGDKVELVLSKRRYVCPRCNKRFDEPNPFLPRYYRMTARLIESIIDLLANERSFTSVAKEIGVSVSTVIRIFDHIQYPKIQKCPGALSIDEFKGNTGGEKFNVILCDAKNKVVLDILPQRKENYLIDYFKNTDRSQVEYFISDMWTTYREIAKSYFSQATFLVDKYHWMRQVIWAFEAVRKETQKHLHSDVRKYFKRSRSLLIKRYDSLEPEQKQAVDTMLWYSSDIHEAHSAKEWFYRIIDSKDPNFVKKELKYWMESAHGSELKPFRRCANALTHWCPGILNSIDHPYTNGFTEGCNNKIKVLKRNAYGYQRFDRFRNRILHIFSHQKMRNVIAESCTSLRSV